MTNNPEPGSKFFNRYWSELEARTHKVAQNVDYSIEPTKNYRHVNLNGVGGFFIHVTVRRDKRWIRAGINLQHPHADDWFEILAKRRAEIERKLPFCVLWEPKVGKQRSQINSYGEFRNIDLKLDWPNQHDWMIDRIIKLREVFDPFAKSL